MHGWEKQNMTEVAVRYCSDAPPAASPVLLLPGRSPGSQVLICRLPMKSPFPYILGGSLTVAYWQIRTRLPLRGQHRHRVNSLTCFPFNSPASRREHQSSAHFSTSVMNVNKRSRKNHKPLSKLMLTV